MADRLDPSTYETIVETAISPFLFLDHTGTITWVSDSLTELLGYEPDDLIGTSGIAMIHPDHRESVLHALLRTEERPSERGAAWSSGGLIVDLLTRDGECVACDISAVTPARTGLDGLVIQIRRAANAASLRRAVEVMAAGAGLDEVLTVVAQGVASGLADASVALLWDWGDDRFHQQVGSHPDLPDLTRAGPTAPWTALALQPGQPLVTDDPTRRPAELTHHGPVEGFAVHATRFDHLDRPAGAAVIWWSSPGFSALVYETITRACDILRLVLQWHEGRRSLEWEASHDSLTGLTNRRAFVDGIVRRLADGITGAVFYLDLDHFKAVNDAHGHLVGDQMLAAAGERLRASARPDDVVARLGGDEFAVFCPGLDDERAAIERGQRFVDALSDPITVEGISAVVGASVGVALVDGDTVVDEVLARADAMLLEAKADGRGRVRIRR